MNGDRTEFTAPWGRLLMGMSGGVLALFAWLAVEAKADGAVLVLFPLILLCALPFMVRGYVVSRNELAIKRLGWTTRFPMGDLLSAEIDPDAMCRSIRLCGNGGLFSFTGLYRNKKLGNYRVFVNDLNRTVVLRFSKRTIVVSPDDPAGFVVAVEARLVVPPVYDSAEWPPEGGTANVQKGSNGESNVTQRQQAPARLHSEH